MEGKVCLVTGANRGIGRATVEGLARRGATVLMVCRTREAGEAARSDIVARTGNRNLELFAGDLAVAAEVRRVAEAIKSAHLRLDVLISNAGTFQPRRTITVDSIETTFAVNHLAGVILISELAGRLRAGAPARVILVASEAHRRVTRPNDWMSTVRYGGFAAYSRSKLANVIFTYCLARRFDGSGITVNCCHPGLVNTPVLAGIFEQRWLHWLWPFVRTCFTITPARGAETVLYLATSPDVEGMTGKYFKHRRPVRSSPISHDPDVGARLWELTFRLTGERM